MNILSVNSDAKTIKGLKFGYLTGISYLAPSKESGYNTCKNASKGCAKACLFTAGHGVMKHVREPRIAKTIAFFKNRKIWFKDLRRNLDSLIKKGIKDSLKTCIRLNGTSDLPWENIKVDNKSIIETYPDNQFYDYTKSYERMIKFLEGKMPKNYHLTFSRSETNDIKSMDILKRGGNVAMVFHKTLPATYRGYKVINGDLSDLRFLDKKNVIVGLKGKGKASKDDSGFVIRNH